MEVESKKKKKVLSNFFVLSVSVISCNYFSYVKDVLTKCLTEGRICRS